MDKRLSFDTAVAVYEKRRPKYNAQLFHDIIAYSGVTNNSSLIEVGCGTGQATEPFLMRGCKVTAVEIGPNFADFCRNKFSAYQGFSVIRSSFEDYKSEENSYDLLYSATAFHWISPEMGYKKAYNVLKPGGSIALFWNRPSGDQQNPLHSEIQKLYQKYAPQWVHKKNANNNRYAITLQYLPVYGFNHVQKKQYYGERRMSGEGYIELLNTYSDHMMLDDTVKIPFFQAIKSKIEEYGNEIIINDTVDLYLGKKN